MKGPRASVIIVSRQRPDDLMRCLLGLGQQYHRDFEVIVVADTDTLATVRMPEPVTTVTFDEPNISAARNAGARKASTPILAFIDDDAVAEPTWLGHLTSPLADPDIGLSGGFVLGRNGISLQWGARSVDAAGWDHPIDHEGTDSFVPEPQPQGRAVRVQGTNMAMRRDILRGLGGFDEAFAFYHDETDLSRRASAAGYRTAVVPKALVHHRFAASPRRRSDRAPTSLYEVGASSAVFHHKHLRELLWAEARETLFNKQRARLSRYLVDGRCEPRDVIHLLSTLLQGYDDGLLRRVGAKVKIGSADPRAFRPFRPDRPERDAAFIAGTWRNRKTLHKEALAAVDEGRVTTVFAFSPTTLFHSVAFTPDGYWLQTGGVFGKSARDQAFYRRFDVASRAEFEIDRLQGLRSHSVSG